MPSGYLCRNPFLRLASADSYYSAMAILNTALTVQARWLLEKRGADLTTNKNLKFWEEENGPGVEETEKK